VEHGADHSVRPSTATDHRAVRSPADLRKSVDQRKERS